MRRSDMRVRWRRMRRRYTRMCGKRKGNRKMKKEVEQ